MLIPSPRLRELDSVDVAASPEVVWKLLRHGDLARSPLVRALFAIRTLPERLASKDVPPFSARLDDLVSTEQRPGFQILAEEPAREVAVGAIGKVWRLEIPFTHVDGAAAFAAFDTTGWIKVAWAIRVTPRGDAGARVEVEVRVAATDDASWKRFERYFRIIGPGSRFIRASLLASIARDLGVPDANENLRALPGDELLPDAPAQITHGITINAPPDRIWPWLVQMGCHRGGFYAVDLLDNGGAPSARDIHPELQSIEVGDVLPAAPGSPNGFEVLRIDAPRALILGGLFDIDADTERRFDAPRPAHFWQVTWSFILEPLDAQTTRLHVRARAAFSVDERLHAEWIRPVHHFMQVAQLRHIKTRAEGRMPRDGAREIVSGLGGAMRMLLALLTPFLRNGRSHWGLDVAAGSRVLPGDSLIPNPRWQWTHGIVIDAPIDDAWPFVAQMGATHGGFYSYQWLENLVGCEVRNAETVHPEWVVHEGDAFTLHPEAPPLRVVEVCEGRYFVAHAAPDEASRNAGGPWASASWSFFLEPIDETHCRFISRFRSAYSDDVQTALVNGPVLLEPVGFVMDRRMLLGLKERVERRAREAIVRKSPEVHTHARVP